MFFKGNFLKSLFILVIASISLSCAQKPSEIISNSIDFCDSNIDESVLPQLIVEFNVLESYFIERGLLQDNSGKSYFSVYKHIAKENDINFESDIELHLIDSIEFNILSKCFFKLLTSEQIDKLEQRHFEASQKVYASVKGNVSPSLIAQRIIDNFTEQDFDLEFYKLSALLTFYKISKPTDFNISQSSTSDFEKIGNKILIELNEKSQLIVFGKNRSTNELDSIVSEFIVGDIRNKAVEISASRGASYESYINILEIVTKRFDFLKNEASNKEFGKPLTALSTAELKLIKQQVPTNIIFIEPK